MIELLKNNSMNEQIMKLVEDKQLSYRSIYNLKPIELETFKIFIETYLKTRFI